MNTTSSSPNPTTEQLINGKELCHILGISPRALHDYRTRGLIPYVRFSKRCIRYDLSAVKKAVGRLTVSAID